MSGKVHDRALLDALESLPTQVFSGEIWRATWSNRGPLIGSSDGGRWDPPNSFEVLYASTELDGSLAEAYYHLSQAPVFSTSEVLLHRLYIDVKKVLHLDEKLLQTLGIEDPKANRINYSQSQAISSAARFLEYQGILVPSARWDCMNLVLYLDQLDINASITIKEHEPINWPAWKERHKKRIV